MRFDRHQPGEGSRKFEALVTQLIIAAGAVGFAFGFERLLKVGLGKLGRTAEQIKDTVEFWENPVLQASGSSSNIYPAAEGSRDTDVPAGVRPDAFLTKNLEELEAHNQALEEAFASLAADIKKTNNTKLDAIGISAWEEQYKLLNGLNSACKGVEAMKEHSDVARILERYIRAGWIRAQAKNRTDIDGKGVVDYPAGKPDPSKPLPPGTSYALDLGSHIEDRLNEIGVSKLAQVTLRGHWYRGNDPDDWEQQLIAWGLELPRGHRRRRPE